MLLVATPTKAAEAHIIVSISLQDSSQVQGTGLLLKGTLTKVHVQGIQAGGDLGRHSGRRDLRCWGRHGFRPQSNIWDMSLLLTFYYVGCGWGGCDRLGFRMDFTDLKGN